MEKTINNFKKLAVEYVNLYKNSIEREVFLSFEDFDIYISKTGKYDISFKHIRIENFDNTVILSFDATEKSLKQEYKIKSKNLRELKKIKKLIKK